ncbi:MAG: hypothetical protein FJ144_25050 [Deltaproteobacteria bacterium]|nr:hypothetical protein [Deltaproteobacteria bacterium]
MGDKPTPAAPPTLTRLAADALIETIDGPVEIVKLVGKVMPVLTRFADGQLGFRMMTQIRELEAEANLIRLVNADGQVVCVGAEHMFVRADGSEVPASGLVVGDRLEPGWSYLPGYILPDAAEYAADVRGKPWENPVVIRSIEPGGSGPLYGASVRDTKSYFLTFGARCRAQA